MDSAIVAVSGTLLGAVLGVVGTYFSQRSGHEREAKERLATTRRQIYVDFLIATHEMFVEMREIHVLRREDAVSDAEAATSLREVPAGAGQSTLEHLRLIAGEDVASAAANLWTRLRRDPEPTGLTVSRRAFFRWSNSYWHARRELIDAARTDFGFPPLDWDAAGVGSSAPTEPPERNDSF